MIELPRPSFSSQAYGIDLAGLAGSCKDLTENALIMTWLTALVVDKFVSEVKMHTDSKFIVSYTSITSECRVSRRIRIR